ncbi:MAG TPA: carboxylesterase family protein [Clostridia bacterium]|nr:carboxylesterase family protein [Clostridia bacterium]HUM60987.1 carboxylesterase family protein [Clostridia bacterium]
MRKFLAFMLILMMTLSSISALAAGELSYEVRKGATVPVFVKSAAGETVGLSYGGVNVFKGIPYATAERFKEPVPFTWEGIRQANRYTEICPQGISAVNRNEVQNLCNYIVEGEDTCLSINIWTPSVDPEAKLPVLVWLHGGGYSSGSSAEHRIYEGYNLAKYGNVVFVSLNHRLNYLGFLDLSEYGEEFKYSANLSFVDILCALEWVHDNIAAYGGDPNCVTIDGQSGGGGKVATLMGIPRAEGLFHRAVAQSGGSASSTRTSETSRAQTAELVKYLGLEGKPGEEIVKTLQEMPYDELRAACREVKYSAGPTIDGDFYTGSVAFSAGKVPLMRTSVFSEFTSNAGPLYGGPVWESKEVYLENYFPAMTDEIVIAKYQEKYGDKWQEVMDEFLKAYPDHKAVDGLYVTNRNNNFVTDYTNMGGTAYQAVIAYNQPLLGGITAIHTGGDIFLFFRNTKNVADYWIMGDEENAERCSMAMADALVAFMKTGDPSTESLAWPAFTIQEGATMIFDANSRVGYFHDADLMALIAK